MVRGQFEDRGTMPADAKKRGRKQSDVGVNATGNVNMQAEAGRAHGGHDSIDGEGREQKRGRKDAAKVVASLAVEEDPWVEHGMFSVVCKRILYMCC